MLSLSKDDLIRLRSNYNPVNSIKDKHLTLEELYILESLEEDLISLRSNYNQELLSIKERKNKHLTLEELYILESLEEEEFNNDDC